jgi:hypothetical protein
VRPLGVVLPAYFHPEVDAVQWRRLARSRLGEGCAVFNVASGPGTRRHDVYARAVDVATGAGVRFAAYCDVAYGQRRDRVVLDHAARYRDWYGIDAVFLDRVPAGASHLRRLRRLEGRLRSAGARRIVLNFGAPPAADLAELGDVLVTFEGPWRDYRDDAWLPDWVRVLPPARQCHLVYDVPAGATDAALRLAAERGAGLVYVTDGSGANPWDRVAGWVAR